MDKAFQSTKNHFKRVIKKIVGYAILVWWDRDFWVGWNRDFVWVDLGILVLVDLKCQGSLR